MIAESAIVSDIVAIMGALGTLVMSLVALAKILKLKKTATALEAVAEVIEYGNLNEEIKDNVTGEIVIDPRENIKRSVDAKTKELKVADVMSAIVRKVEANGGKK